MFQNDIQTDSLLCIQALGIRVHVLHDWTRTKAHCNQVFKSAPKDNSNTPSGPAVSKDIYFALLCLCLEPCTPDSLGVQLPSDWLLNEAKTQIGGWGSEESRFCIVGGFV